MKEKDGMTIIVDAFCAFFSGMFESFMDTKNYEGDGTHFADYVAVDPFKAYDRIVQPGGYEASDLPTEEEE